MVATNVNTIVTPVQHQNRPTLLVRQTTIAGQTAMARSTKSHFRRMFQA